MKENDAFRFPWTAGQMLVVAVIVIAFAVVGHFDEKWRRADEQAKAEHIAKVSKESIYETREELQAGLHMPCPYIRHTRNEREKVTSKNTRCTNNTGAAE